MKFYKVLWSSIKVLFIELLDNLGSAGFMISENTIRQESNPWSFGFGDIFDNHTSFFDVSHSQIAAEIISGALRADKSSFKVLRHSLLGWINPWSFHCRFQSYWVMNAKEGNSECRLMRSHSDIITTDRGSVETNTWRLASSRAYRARVHTRKIGKRYGQNGENKGIRLQYSNSGRHIEIRLFNPLFSKSTKNPKDFPIHFFPSQHRLPIHKSTFCKNENLGHRTLTIIEILTRFTELYEQHTASFITWNPVAFTALKLFRFARTPKHWQVHS